MFSSGMFEKEGDDIREAGNEDHEKLGDAGDQDDDEDDDDDDEDEEIELWIGKWDGLLFNDLIRLLLLSLDG